MSRALGPICVCHSRDERGMRCYCVNVSVDVSEALRYVGLLKSGVLEALRSRNVGRDSATEVLNLATSSISVSVVEARAAVYDSSQL